MKNRWYKPEDTIGKACPFSIGQAETGRYTFCVHQQCMAWQWYIDDEYDRRAHEHDQAIPEGWSVVSEVYEIDGGKFFDIIKTPTHGRCGLIPRG